MQAVNLATNQIENMVEALLGHAKNVRNISFIFENKLNFRWAESSRTGRSPYRRTTVRFEFWNDANFQILETGGKFVHREEELTEPPRLEHHQEQRIRRESAGRDEVR